MPASYFCKNCGKIFSAPPSAKRQFCSHECCLEHRKKAFAERKMDEALVCLECGETFYAMPSRRWRAAYCSLKCKQTVAGRKGGTVRGEQVKALSEGKAYTKTKGRHTHRKVMEKILGRPLRKGEIVHHKDGNKLNNHPDNLELMTQSEHVRRHHKEMMEKRREIHGH